MAQKPPFATAQHEDDDQQRGPLMGFLTTRVMTSEREPLFGSRQGLTVGQMIDQRIEAMNREFEAMVREHPDQRQPELHSITFEFPAE